ncbi:glycosyltransferase [Rhodosalinus sp. 5P4]|uniref:glycosyltransferase n=1 Tax=Rhodosalinus sp. 5P4 TaxID=3239196 RepID=UPI003524A84D
MSTRTNGLAKEMTRSVSVIIPAYNADRFLKEAVHSVFQQSVPPLEIIIVDDGSQDRTLETARDLASQDARIAVLTGPNGGAAAARNAGLSKASGDYLLFLDADDRLHENAIRDHLRAFAERADAAMVFGSNDVIDENGNLLHANPTPIEEVKLQDIALRVTPCPSQCLYLKSAIQKVNGYNEAFRYSQDIDLNLRLIHVGRIFSHGIKVMDYRRHPHQSTSNGARICKGHLKVLESNLGISAPFPDLDLLSRARTKWFSRYGYRQHLVALGALRRGRIFEAVVAARLAFLRLRSRLRGENWQPRRS